MAIIYSYPTATPTASDLLIGTLTSDTSGDNPTKSFTISDIIGLVPAAGTGGTVTSIGLTNTDSFLTISNSPITTSGNISIDLTNNGGTPSSNTFYRGDGQWAVPPNTVPYTYTITSSNNAPNVDINLTDNFGLVDFIKLVPLSPIGVTSSNNEITISSTAVRSVTSSDSYISVDNTTATTPVLSLASGGTTGDNTKFYRGDGTWATGGTMSSWDLLGDTGTQNITEGEDVKIKGDGSGISVAVADNAGVAEATISLTSTVPVSLTAGTTVQDTSTAATNLDISGTGAVTVKAKNVVSNNSDTYTSYGRITNIISLTAAEYAALVTAGTTDPNTLYVAI